MLRKIRSLVSNSDYFGIYDNVLSKYECKLIIEKFEKSPQHPGEIYLWGYETAQQCDESKKCTELVQIPDFRDGSVNSTIMGPHLSKCLQKYNAEHPQLTPIASWNTCNEYNIQKYVGEDEGYKDWHTEHGPNVNASKRIMAWMFYLNDAKSGTEFMNYPTVQAKRGRCVIWPAAWTHVHRGQIPNKGLKYIATGWVDYNG